MKMNPNDWERAKELFEAALEVEPSERASFLSANCRDVSVQQEVEKLLTDYQAAGNFLDNPALSSKIPNSSAPEEIQIEEVFRSFLSSEEQHDRAKSEETEDPMVNRRLGAYKLVRRVGRGGMAAVFLAVRADEEYQKEVAVKLVQPGLDSQDVLNRFRNERQTLASLEHPNIVRLLDGGSAPEGLPFLVMEYVEGSPIDEYCDRHKLSVDERLRLFGEVCDAVQFAHEKLVIHRDLKPTNILVLADGTPKLLDFGIAKVLNPESSQGWLATQTGLRCMTPAYASPEQTQGKPVSPQTDVYSLGVVLYELLTGHRPYRLTQHSPAEIERAICEQEPETPSTAVSRVETDTSSDGKTITRTPEMVSLPREGEPDRLRRRLRGDLDNIVLKALQKEPQQRYGSVAEFSQDIDRHLQHQPVKARPSTFAYRASKFVQRRKTEVTAAFAVLLVMFAATAFAFNAAGIRDRLGIGSSQTKIQSLAVLPLQSLSGDPNQEYFSDGMTDALITDLAQIGSVKVISRTTSMQYKDTKKSLPEIARELNVDGIVEGTVQRSGDRVRISAQLIYAASDRHLWAKSYESDLRDVFAMERDVTEDIAKQVQARLTTPNQVAVAQLRPINPKALDAYLQGNYHLSRYGKGAGDEEKRKAAGYFQQAIDADPKFAPAYNGLATAHLGLLWPSKQDAEIATKAAERAVELDPNSSDAHKILGDIKLRAWERLGAEEEFRRALALNPNNADAHGGIGTVLDITGRLDDGWKEQQIALELDPNNAALFDERLSCGLELRGQYDRAIAIFQMFLKRDPDDGYLHLDLAREYLKKGMYQDAMPHLEQFWTLFGFPDVSAEVHRALANSGYRGAIRESAKAVERLMATHQAFGPFSTAQLYAAIGEKDRAFYWLEQAYAQHDLGIAGTDIGLQSLAVDPLIEPLRSDPRYNDLLRRVGLPDAQLTTAQQTQSAQQQPANPKALDAYLRGNHYLNRAEWSIAEDDKHTAAQYFQQAIDADPNFAPAYIGLANAHRWLALGSREDTAISKRAAERALELDPNSSEAWEILGYIKWFAFDWAGAEQDFRRAVAVNPNRASSIFSLGYLHAAEGRLDEALREGEISHQLDPTENDLSLILEMRGEHKRAIELLQRMVVLHPTDSGNHAILFRNYVETGMYEEAAQELEKSWTLMGAPEIAADVHRGFAASGYQGAMSEYAKALEAMQAGKKGFAPGTLAEVYTALGDKDRAFYWLEQAYEHHEDVSLDEGLRFIKEDRLLDPLRTDPRFGNLLRRVGLPP